LTTVGAAHDIQNKNKVDNITIFFILVNKFL